MLRQDARRLSCADTAKLVRKALKQAFPTFRFSVRSKTYSGGASINVEWCDGPAATDVDAIVKAFEGAGFDAMIDLKTYTQHWLMPDGSIEFAEVGIGHSFASEHERYAPPHPRAELVHFGADYVFTNRHYSVAFLSEVVAEVCERYGWEPLEVKGSEYGAHLGRCDDYERERTIWRAAEARGIAPEPMPEPEPEPMPTESENLPTITTERDWVWVAFPAKPAQHIIDAMQELGGRWSKRRQVWYFQNADRMTIVAAVN